MYFIFQFSFKMILVLINYQDALMLNIHKEKPMNTLLSIPNVFLM